MIDDNDDDDDNQDNHDVFSHRAVMTVRLKIIILLLKSIDHNYISADNVGDLNVNGNVRDWKSKYILPFRFLHFRFFEYGYQVNII